MIKTSLSSARPTDRLSSGSGVGPGGRGSLHIINQRHFPWAVAVVFGFLACTTTVNGPARTSWEYHTSWTRYGAGPLGEEAKKAFEEHFNDLGNEGWEYCGIVASRDTMDYNEGWAVNLWKRPR